MATGGGRERLGVVLSAGCQQLGVVQAGLAQGATGGAAAAKAAAARAAAARAAAGLPDEDAGLLGQLVGVVGGVLEDEVVDIEVLRVVEHLEELGHVERAVVDEGQQVARPRARVAVGDGDTREELLDVGDLVVREPARDLLAEAVDAAPGTPRRGRLGLLLGLLVLPVAVDEEAEDEDVAVLVELAARGEVRGREILDHLQLLGRQLLERDVVGRDGADGVARIAAGGRVGDLVLGERGRRWRRRRRLDCLPFRHHLGGGLLGALRHGRQLLGELGALGLDLGQPVTHLGALLDARVELALDLIPPVFLRLLLPRQHQTDPLPNVVVVIHHGHLGDAGSGAVCRVVVELVEVAVVVREAGGRAGAHRLHALRAAHLLDVRAKLPSELAP